MKVTKLDAACRQLNTAIRLLFDGGDAVPIHSLVASACNVLADVAERKKGLSWRRHTQADHGLTEKELKMIIHSAWNFFKHANNDPDAVLDFEQTDTEHLIFLGTLDAGSLNVRSCEMEVFQAWFVAAHPQSFPSDEPVFENLKNFFPGLAECTRDTMLSRGRELLHEWYTVARRLG